MEGPILKLAASQETWRRSCNPLQFALRFHKLLYLRKLIVVVKALGIQESARWFDDLTRHDLLHRQLDFLEVHGCLRFVSFVLELEEYTKNVLVYLGSRRCIWEHASRSKPS